MAWRKFKDKSLELIWNDVNAAKFRCGLNSVTGQNYIQFQNWQKRLLEIEQEIIDFNAKQSVDTLAEKEDSEGLQK